MRNKEKQRQEIDERAEANRTANVRRAVIVNIIVARGRDGRLYTEQQKL